MAYNWAQLAFVEKWRLKAVRGPIVGMYRPDNRTFFDLRLHSGQAGTGQLPGSVEIHLLDAGDLIREKRIAITSVAAVVVSVAATAVEVEASSPSPAGGRARRWLEPNSRVAGSVLQIEEDVALVDVGLPLIVRLPEGEEVPGLQRGDFVGFNISETPKGFLVI